MEKKQNVPALRFPDFSGEWKERKISDIADVIGGGTPSTSEPAFWDGEIDWYAPAEMTGKRYADGSVRKITKLGLENSHATILPADKTILFTSRAGIGKVAILKKPAVTNQGFQSMVLQGNNNPYFLYSMGPKITQKAEKVASGSTFLEISGKGLGKISINLPIPLEQECIAHLFEKLDDFLENQEDKIKKLQQFRQAMLTKLFPREGAEEPELHFEGNLNCWKAFRLGDCVDRLDNLRVPVSATNRIAGTTPYYGANGIQDYVSGYTHEGEFILIAEDGANDLDNYPIQYVNGRIWVNNHAHVLQGKPKIVDTKFLKYALSQVDMRFYLVGGSRSKLNSNIMMNIELNLPIDIDEQRKIGDLLGELDKFISLQQKKLERMQRLKAALLEKMFV